MEREQADVSARLVEVVAEDKPDVPITVEVKLPTESGQISDKAVAIAAMDGIINRRDFKRRLLAGEYADSPEIQQMLLDDYNPFPNGPYMAHCGLVSIGETESIELLRHAWPFTGNSRYTKGPSLVEAIEWVLTGRRVSADRLKNIQHARTPEDLERGINVYPYPPHLEPEERAPGSPASNAPPFSESNRLTTFSDPHSQATIRGIWAISNGAHHLWQHPPRTAPYYQDPDTNVLVYLGGAQGSATIEPAEAEKAWRQVLALDDRTVSTFIICLGKWFADTGGSGGQLVSTRIHATDILNFRGVKKHVNGGYRREQKQETREDILALNNIWVRSEQEIIEMHGKRKRKKSVAVDSRLLEVAIESDRDLFGEETPYAFRIRPGEWGECYLSEYNRMTALLLRPIMAYDLRYASTRMAMRLGIYLTMQWRIRAAYGNYNQPWLVRTLLDGACVPIEQDARNYARFREQFEVALDKLQDDGILRWHYVDHDDGQLPSRGWFPVWQKWRVWIEPPSAIPEHYKRLPGRRNRGIAAAKAAGHRGNSPE